MWFLNSFRLNLFKNHPPFGNSAFGGDFFSNELLAVLLFKAVFLKKMWFLNSFRLNLFKNHPPFGNSAFGGIFSPITFWEFCFLKLFLEKMWFLNSFRLSFFKKSSPFLGILLLEMVFLQCLFGNSAF